MKVYCGVRWIIVSKSGKILFNLKNLTVSPLCSGMIALGSAYL